MRLFFFRYCKAVGTDLVDFVTGEVVAINMNFRIGWYTGKIVFHIGRLMLVKDTCEADCPKKMDFGFFNEV